MSRIGNELMTYFIDAPVGAVTLYETGGHYRLTGPEAEDLGVASKSVSIASQVISTPGAWCVSLTNPGGAITDWQFSATAGLAAGTCTSADG